MSRWEKRKEEEGLLLGLLCSPLSFFHLEFSESVSNLKLLLLLFIFERVSIKKKEASNRPSKKDQHSTNILCWFPRLGLWSWFMGSCGQLLEAEHMCGLQHHSQAWISKVRTSNLQDNRSDLLYFTYIRCSIKTYWYDQHVVLALYILISNLMSCNNHIIGS